MNYPVAFVREQRVVAVLRDSKQVAVPMSSVHPVGPKGDPGGNVMSIGLFEDAHLLSIPSGTDIVQTSGYAEIGLGSALYAADLTVDAAYVTANPNTSFISTNSRGFKLVMDQQANVYMFGAVGDDATNDNAAFVAAIAYSYAHAQSGTSYPPNAGPSIFVPFGKYYLGTSPIDITHTIDIFGEGSIGPVGGAASQLRWGAGTNGFRFQAGDTSGDTTTGAQAYGGAHGSSLRNLYLKGAYAGTEGEFHAVLVRARISWSNLFIDNWAGDGISLFSQAGGGNANTCRGDRTFIRQCRDGIHAVGPNSQVGIFTNCDFSQNRRWGGWEESQIGNTYQGVSENNGKTPSTTSTMVSYGGNWYAVVAGQETGASTNAPSGTTADNTWWYYANAGAPNAGANVPAWVSGITVRAGGSFRTSNANGLSVLLMWYSEDGQGPEQHTGTRTLVLGGYKGAGVKGVPVLTQQDGAIRADIFHAAKQLFAGPQLGTLNGFHFLETSDTFTQLNFRRWAGGTPVATDGTIQVDVNGFSYISTAVNFFTGAGGTLVGSFDANGLSLNSGKVVKIGGVQVLGGRQAAIANSGGGDESGKINAILAVMRTNGTIAP